MFEKPHKIYKSNNDFELSEYQARKIGNVHEFRSSPAELLKQWRANVLDEDPDTESLVKYVVDEIEAVFDSALDVPIAANLEMDSVAKSFLETDQHSPDYYRYLLQLLHTAGYNEREVSAWVGLDSTATTPKEMLEDRSLRVLFNEVYGSEE